MNKTKINARAKKLLYFAMPILEARRANREIDRKIADYQSSYVDVPVWVLRTRMKQEHERDTLINTKTDRLGQRILGMIAFFGILFALSPVAEWSKFEQVAGMMSLLLTVRAWWLTVKANETTKVYGVGTEFEFEGKQDRNLLAKELFCQEMENNKKHNVNVTSVRCLRNALIVGILGILPRLMYLLVHLLMSAVVWI